MNLVVIFQDLLSTLGSKTDKSFDILPDIHNSVTDVICSLVSTTADVDTTGLKHCCSTSYLAKKGSYLERKLFFEFFLLHKRGTYKSYF